MDESHFEVHGNPMTNNFCMNEMFLPFPSRTFSLLRFNSTKICKNCTRKMGLLQNKTVRWVVNWLSAKEFRFMKVGCILNEGNCSSAGSVFLPSGWSNFFKIYKIKTFVWKKLTEKLSWTMPLKCSEHRLNSVCQKSRNKIYQRSKKAKYQSSLQFCCRRMLDGNHTLFNILQNHLTSFN